jgi:hypothetical protein
MNADSIVVLLASSSGIASLLLATRFALRRGAAREVQVRYRDTDGKERLLIAGGSEKLVNDAADTLRSLEGSHDRDEIAATIDALVNRNSRFLAIEPPRPRRMLP